MKITRPLIASLLVSAAALAFFPLGQAAQAPRGGPPAVREPGGPLKPDGPIAKAYNDAARALAEINSNPIVDWQYRVWCVTGYRTPDAVGTGVAVDPLPNGPVTDLVSPKGVLHRSIGDDSPFPANGLKIFDNAWYFGDDMTGSVVVRTPDGLIMYDALTTVDDAERLLIAPMRAAGLDPADVKLMFVGHGHGDHTGGMETVRKYAPGAKIVAGRADFDSLTASRQRLLTNAPNPNQPNAPPMTAEERTRRLLTAAKPDIAVDPIAGFRHGASRIKVGTGNTEIVAILQPGHTQGQLSIIAPVTWRGQPHKLFMWSGNDTGANNVPLYAASGDWARAVTQIEGADAYINTHGYQGAVFHHARQIAANPNGANNLILGKEGIQALLGIFSNCQRAFYQRIQDGTWKGM